MSQHADREGRAAMRQQLSARTGQWTGSGAQAALGARAQVQYKRQAAFLRPKALWHLCCECAVAAIIATPHRPARARCCAGAAAGMHACRARAGHARQPHARRHPSAAMPSCQSACARHSLGSRCARHMAQHKAQGSVAACTRAMPANATRTTGLSVWTQQPVRCTCIALHTPPCPAPEEAMLQRWPRQRRQASGKPPAVDAVASLATAAAQTAAAAGARHACGSQRLPWGCSVTLGLARAGRRDFGTRQRSRVCQGTGHRRARPPCAARRLPGQAHWTTHPRLAGRLPC
jgi:hypothetical protein